MSPSPNKTNPNHSHWRCAPDTPSTGSLMTEPEVTPNLQVQLPAELISQPDAVQLMGLLEAYTSQHGKGILPLRQSQKN